MSSEQKDPTPGDADSTVVRLPPGAKIYHLSHPIIFLGIIVAKLALGFAILSALWDKDPLTAIALMLAYVVFLK
jgi:energy-converting hydrogenase Eha subunit C